MDCGASAEREGFTLQGVGALSYDGVMKIEIEREQDGRWIAEVMDLPGALAYGKTRDEAIAKAKALALRVVADRLEHGEEAPEMMGVFSVAV